MNSIVRLAVCTVAAASLLIVAGCGGGGGSTSAGSSSPPAVAPSTGTPAPVSSVGADLYAANCAGCHDALAVSTKQGITVARLQFAIANNVGGMGFLSTLTPADQQNIIVALSPPATPVPATDGAALYAANCAGCHGALASSTKANITLARLQNAITANTGGMGFLSTLTAAQQQAVVTALATTVTPPPVTDGATLYATNCAGCHGALASSTKANITLARLQNAITANTGGMGFLSTLTAAQQQAVVTALVTTVTPPPVTDGATLYTNNCAGCHGALATSGKAGATTARIQTAITNNTGGMGPLSTLTATQISAIATALAGVTTPPAPAPACGSCHAIPPVTGKHTFHNGKRVACATCHGSGYSTTTVNAATHNNGVKNLATTIGWNSTSRSCSNSCHGTKSW